MENYLFEVINIPLQKGWNKNYIYETKTAPFNQEATTQFFVVFNDKY